MQVDQKEIKEGIIPDPATIDPATGQPLDSAAGMDLGQPVKWNLKQMDLQLKHQNCPRGGEI